MSLRLVGKAPPESSAVSIIASTDSASMDLTASISVLNLSYTNTTSTLSCLPVALSLDQSRFLLLHPSKMDLVDHTTLTSLPLPPPPARSRLKRGRLAPVCQTTSKSLCRDPSGSLEETLHEETEIADLTITSEYLDETFEESEDLIVLVEDYMASHDVGQQVDRKKSLLSFKKRHNEDRSSLESSCPPSKRFERTESKDTEDLEAIFGRIPGTDRLKHCCLCDRPLYEISSILGNSESVRRGNSKSTQLCDEFVCWDCVDVYEQFLTELSESEAQDEQAKVHSTNRLLGIFTNINDLYNAPSAGNVKTFSNGLIDKLHHLSDVASPEEKEPAWLTALKYKLRWRWRLNGLLPNPFNLGLVQLA